MNLYQTGFDSYSADELNRAVLRCYGWMCAGLLVTAGVSWFMYASNLLLWLLIHMPILTVLLPIAQIGLVIAFTAMMNKASAATLKVLFLVYAATLGISLTSLAYVYELGQIAAAFVTTAVYFGCLIFIGATTKKDMSKFGTICLGGLLALILSQLVMGLFGVGMNTRLVSIIGLLLFTGITVWDIQKMPKVLASAQGMGLEKLTVYMALELYLDFINIFLYILRLLGSKNRN